MLPQLLSLQNGFSSPGPALFSQAPSLCGVKGLGVCSGWPAGILMIRVGGWLTR